MQDAVIESKPTLGIYGPYGDDKSGVSRYIRDSIAHLEDHYSISVISNSTTWIDPHTFDAALYHLGNNGMHHSAFEAARRRPGVALLHEYLHLDYYYGANDRLPPDLRSQILADLIEETGIAAATLDQFVKRCQRSGAVDPYTVDIGIEKYAIHASNVTVVHSNDVAVKLRARYPGSKIAVLRFPIRRWPEHRNRRYAKCYRLGEAGFTFGTFGFIGDYKQVAWVLAAWRQWHDRPDDAQLLLVGERQIDINADAEGVLETGYVDDATFVALLGAVDCGIQLRHPSLGETSAPTAELAAHRRPLIISDIPEMRSLDQGARTIYVRSDENVISSLIAAMRRQYETGRPPPFTFDGRFSWHNWKCGVLSLLGRHF